MCSPKKKSSGFQAPDKCKKMTWRMSQSNLFQGPEPDPRFTGTQSEQVSFSKDLKEHEHGILKPTESKSIVKHNVLMWKNGLLPTLI